MSQYIGVDQLDSALVSKLSGIDMLGGHISLSRDASNQFGVYVARNAKGEEVNLPQDIADSLLHAAYVTMDGKLRVEQYIVPEIPQLEKAGIYKPAMHYANRPKREDYSGDEARYFRELVKWEQARGVSPGA